MIPQLIYIGLALIGLGMTFAKHGDDKTGKHNGWLSLVSLSIALWILYSGGFFNPLFE